MGIQKTKEFPSKQGRKNEAHKQLVQHGTAGPADYDTNMRPVHQETLLNDSPTALNVVTPQTVFLGIWPGDLALGPGPTNSACATKKLRKS